jgi:AraC-like DNA-binding protein
MNWLALPAPRPGVTIRDVPVDPYPLGVATWPAAMILWSPGFTSTPHRHPVMQLVLSLSGSLRIRGGRDLRWKRCGAALVRSNAVHEVDTQRNSVVLAYVLPQSELGVALAELLTDDITSVAPRLVSGWRAALGSPVSRDSVEHWVTRRLLNGQSPDGDGRLRRVLTYVRARIRTSNHFPLSLLAHVAGLSDSRFQHIFRQEFGVAVRPYIRWLRLQRAACDLIGGASLTEAAHAAGFSDTAHMSRTFRSTLGVAPSDISRRVHVNLGLWRQLSSSGVTIHNRVGHGDRTSDRRPGSQPRRTS